MRNKKRKRNRPPPKVQKQKRPNNKPTRHRKVYDAVVNLLMGILASSIASDLGSLLCCFSF
jgi:hypothetical protein